eukprot:scaffold117511_cov66-Phaeocystis_antarctica.AAC.2
MLGPSRVPHDHIYLSRRSTTRCSLTTSVPPPPPPSSTSTFGRLAGWVSRATRLARSTAPRCWVPQTTRSLSIYQARKEAYNPNPNPNPNQARKEAYKLMSRDTFRRFVREDEYQCLVQELGSYKGSTSLAAMSLSNVKLEGV